MKEKIKLFTEIYALDNYNNYIFIYTIFLLDERFDAITIARSYKTPNEIFSVKNSKKIKVHIK